MQTMSSSRISLNTFPGYLPLVEEHNKSRLGKLPNLVDILKKSQLSIAHVSTEKAQIAFANKSICKNANDLVALVKDAKQTTKKNFDVRLDSYKKFLDTTDSSTKGVVVLGSTVDAGDISDRIKEYLVRFDTFIKRTDTELSTERLGHLYVTDLATFNQAKESFVTENAALVREGEQWLKLLQDLLSNYTGKNEKSQENRRYLQDKVLHALNILPLQVQLTEALFTQISVFKTQVIAKGIFHTRMVQFSDKIRAIYNSNEQADFVSLQGEKDEYLLTYQEFIKNANADREKHAELQRSMPVIPSREAITTHLNTLIMNDAGIEGETRKQSEDILRKTIKIYEDSKKDLEAVQAKVDGHISSLLKHRIDRLLNGIDWKDFSRTTWKRSILNWTKYSDMTN